MFCDRFHWFCCGKRGSSRVATACESVPRLQMRRIRGRPHYPQADVIHYRSHGLGSQPGEFDNSHQQQRRSDKSHLAKHSVKALSRYYMCHRTKIEAITPRQRRSRPRLESWAESQVGAGVCDHRRYPYGTEKHIYLISSTADLKLHTTSLVHGEMRRKRAPLWQGQRCWWLYPSPETSDEVLDSHRH